MIGATVEDVLSLQPRAIGHCRGGGRGVRERDRFGVSYGIIPTHADEDFAPVELLCT